MDPSEQAIALIQLLRRCGHYLHFHSGQGRFSQNRTLRILNEHGEVTQRQLQDLMGIQQGSLSEVVKKLEGQGLIVRERGLSDQRQLLIRVTEKGKELNRQNCEIRRQQTQALVAALDGEERQRLLELLAKLLDSWENRRDQTGPGPDAEQRGAEEGRVKEDK